MTETPVEIPNVTEGAFSGFGEPMPGGNDVLLPQDLDQVDPEPEPDPDPEPDPK